MRRFRTSASDRGLASTFLLMGLTLALLAMMVLFFRIGDANLLRSNAQTAADAAALAAGGEMADALAQRMAGSRSMVISFAQVEEEAEAAAEHYANANDAILTDLRTSDNDNGFRGNFIRVEVIGAQCRRHLEEDRSVEWGDYYCPPPPEEEGLRDIGNASAIAEVIFPECEYRLLTETLFGLFCGNQNVAGAPEVARQFIEVRLVDAEGQWLHTGEEPDPSVPEEADDPPGDEDEEEPDEET